MVTPVLKWAGGKRGLTSDILGLFPPDYRRRAYHEPFVGGGAVFFQVRPRAGTINDINPRLINFYRVVRDSPEELIAQARQYPYDEETYYRLRERFNQKGLPPVEEAALFLYLNKTAYNGLYRVNSKGEFNVPFGRHRNPRIVPEAGIRAASKALRRVEIFNRDFSYVVDFAGEGDLCYLDPPYQPVSPTANFTEYSEGGFDMDQQERLRDVCVELHEKGVLFVLSNSDVEAIRELYGGEGFRVVVVRGRRSIGSKAHTRGSVNELLITNIPPGNSPPSP